MIITKAAVASLGLLILASSAIADPVNGFVNADGSVAVQSSQYIVTHPKKGHYAIKFTIPMEPVANCLITPVGKSRTSGSAFVWQYQHENGYCLVVFHESGQKGPIDTAFSFIALPISN